MLIYVFMEDYPSQYKPYFDTQFEQFLKDGHILRMFSLRGQKHNFTDKVKLLKLHKYTSHTPSTIRTLPIFLFLILTNLLRNPVRRFTTAIHIYSSELSTKQYFMQVMRMMVLPLEKPDLCLIHNLVTAVQFTFLRDMYHECPIAFYYHGGEVPGVPEIGEKQSRQGFAAADFIFTNTESSKSDAINRGCDASKITICPVGFNVSEFDADGIRNYKNENVLQLLTIGRLSEEKGHIYALRAIYRLIKSGIINIHYKIIGDGPLHEELKRYVIEHGIGAYVEFPGYISRDALYAELKNADVHILPSIVVGTWMENQACVVQEAMLFKTLVINSNAGGVPESTAPIMRQFCLEPENPQMIVDSVIKLIAATDEDLQSMGEQCRLFALEKYNIETLNHHILSVCNKNAGQLRHRK